MMFLNNAIYYRQQELPVVGNRFQSANDHYAQYVPPPPSGPFELISSVVTLELRLYAMYGRSRKILAFLLFLIACETCAMGVIFGVPKAGLIGEREILAIP